MGTRWAGWGRRRNRGHLVTREGSSLGQERSIRMRICWGAWVVDMGWWGRESGWHFWGRSNSRDMGSRWDGKAHETLCSVTLFGDMAFFITKLADDRCLAGRIFTSWSGAVVAMCARGIKRAIEGRHETMEQEFILSLPRNPSWIGYLCCTAEDVEELCSVAIEDGGCVVLMGKTGRIETRESAQSSDTIKDFARTHKACIDCTH
ncbi:hypothetical protein Droror1_Dr00023455 [Drosera rotundifolia]